MCLFTYNCSVLTFIISRSSQGSASHSGRVDLSTHTLSLLPDGKLHLVPLDPSKIKVKNQNKQTVSVQEDIVAPVTVSTSETVPDIDITTGNEPGISASAGANSPGASTSLGVGAVGGTAAVSVSSPGLKTSASAADSADVGLQTRNKRKGFSMPGFGKKDKPVVVGEEAGASREAKVRTMPHHQKDFAGSLGMRSKYWFKYSNIM